MELMQWIQSIGRFMVGDTPWLADIVYPLLAGICAMVTVLSVAWYYMPPRPRHPLHCYVALIAGSLIIPALLASAATGHVRSFDVETVRNTLRLAWLLVGASLFSVVIYYLRRFWLVWSAPQPERAKFLQRWTPTADRSV